VSLTAIKLEMETPVRRSAQARMRGYYRRRIASLLFKRPLEVRTAVPLVSFTFDDFPRTALWSGGEILERHGATGTYYTSLGIMGTEGPSGPLFVLDDLRALLRKGHELGCHTFSHCHSWDTRTSNFEEGIQKNSAALKSIFPEAEFKSLSYPISEPRPLTKRKTAKYFRCSRGGGQTLNAGTADLNQLSAFFLEKSRNRIQDATDLIDLNKKLQGWIIFATHDVSPDPSPFGCTPQFFEEVVSYAENSGARILPVAGALEAICSARGRE
jgi:peptidoglycan/xylan/chitin deacetylase (PgdA/CDA1 family)